MPEHFHLLIGEAGKRNLEVIFSTIFLRPRRLVPRRLPSILIKGDNGVL
jgi:hypothetical protein